ncbi:MAG: TrkA family potassium uptake protein [Deltaproteobacteria bacterium]|nr:TrkA family potassium uptake protein [Deltaproteobacteria bacterium]
MRKILVVGLGKFGMTMAQALGKGGAEVIAVDNHIDNIEEIKDHVSYAAQLDSTEPRSLAAVGADKVDVAVVAIGESFEAAVLTAAALKEMKVREIICRANTDREARILKLAGATKVIQIEQDMAKKIAAALLTPNMVEHVELAEGYSIIEWEVDKRFIGRPLIDCRFRTDFGVNVIAIHRVQAAPATPEAMTETMELVPDPSYVFEKGDVVVVIGREENLKRLTGVDMEKE